MVTLNSSGALRASDLPPVEGIRRNKTNLEPQLLIPRVSYTACFMTTQLRAERWAPVGPMELKFQV